MTTVKPTGDETTLFFIFILLTKAIEVILRSVENIV